VSDIQADGRTQFSKPLVGDTHIYVGGLGQELRCYPRGKTDPDPTWTFAREGSLSDSSPVLDEEHNQIYIGSGGGNLSAVDAGTGEQNWVVETDSAITSTPLLKQEHVFVGTNDGRVLRVEADSGTRDDSTELDGPIYGGLNYFEEESKYLTVVTAVGTVYRLRWYDFDVDWKQETGGEDVRSSPIFEHDYGTIVATDKVYKFKQNSGDLKLEAEFTGSVATTPLYNGFVIVGDDEGTLTAFNRNTGDVRWSYDAGSPITGDPVQSGGRVLFGTQDGAIHSIAVSDETDVTTETVAGESPSAPVVDEDVVYVAVDDTDGGDVVQLDRQTLGMEPLPTISAVDSTGETDNGDPVFEVEGSGFTDKDRGGAVLYDFVDETYERGNLNPFNGNFYDHEQDLDTADSELDRIYDRYSLPGGRGGKTSSAQYISDESEQAHRHDGVDAHYRMRDWSYIGAPMAYGGRGNNPDGERRYERPDDKDQLYIAWWLRPTFSIKDHIAVEVESVEGEFEFGDKRERGERIRVPDAAPGSWDTDDLTGWIIGVRDGEGSSDNDDGLFEVEFDCRHLDELEGSTIVGEESGAEAEISAELHTDEDDKDLITYTRGSKLMRAFEHPGRREFSFAWSPNGLNPGHMARQYWGTSGMPNPREWNLLEFVADREEGWIEGWVNFQKRGRVEWDPQETEADISPSLGTLGQETIDYGYNTFRISEVYQDSSVQRVVVADAETLEEASHYELQRPTEWSDGRLRFALNDGQLPTDEQLYVFVFDDQGQANQQGHPISLSTGGGDQ